MKKFTFVIFISVIFLFGCSRKAVDDTINAATGIGAVEKKIEASADIAKIQCIELCRGAIAEDMDLDAGPCIGDPIPNVLDWVCDVAHNPRQAVDDDPKNQCSAFRDGKAKHFIEVDPNCNFIKSY